MNFATMLLEAAADASAAGAQTGAVGGLGLSYIISIVAMLAIFYFLLLRPQKKEQKRMQEMLKEMEVGDVVVTTSGFYGVLIDITEDDVIVEFGSNKTAVSP